VGADSLHKVLKKGLKGRYSKISRDCIYSGIRCSKSGYREKVDIKSSRFYPKVGGPHIQHIIGAAGTTDFSREARDSAKTDRDALSSLQRGGVCEKNPRFVQCNRGKKQNTLWWVCPRTHVLLIENTVSTFLGDITQDGGAK